MQQTGAQIIWKQFSSWRRLNKHPCLPQPLRCQICLALKVILRHAWALRLDPAMQVDSIERPQNETPHELPLVGRLSPFLVLLNRPLNASEKRWGWNWAKRKHIYISFSFLFYIGNCCRNYILDYPIDFVENQSIKIKIISAKWLLLWRQENCMWLRKAHCLTHPYSKEMRQRCTENHVSPNKSMHCSDTFEHKLPWLSADHSGV